MKTTSLPLTNSLNRSPSRAGFFLIPLTFALFVNAPAIRAQCPQICDSNDNTALGAGALVSNTIGGGNTATGTDALLNNTFGNINTANGWDALVSNTTGGGNTACGAEALYTNTTGVDNTASGAGALFNNTTGEDNTVSGNSAAYQNTTGSGNTVSGWNAFEHNTIGNNNTATGITALQNNTTGSGNIALGNAAGSNLTTGSNNIDIGNAGVASDSKKIRIGKTGTQTATFIAGISGATVPSGVGVIVGSNGQLGTVVSSKRFKEAIKPMDMASKAILALKPVTFRYKHELDPAGIAQFGLIAEDVEKVDPALVARDEQGKPYTVRYEAVNAMLLNEFLKEHNAFVEEQRKVQQQGAAIAQQRKEFEAAIAQQHKEIDALTATVKQQAAQIQKVSAQFELSKPGTQTVLNNR